MKRSLRHLFALCVALTLPAFVLLAQERANVPDDLPAFPGAPVASMQKTVPPSVAGQWSTGATLPIPKKYHAVASLDDFMYIFGGVTTGNAYNAKAYKYSFSSNTWTPIADYPITRFLIGVAAAVNGKIYIMGGLDNFGNSYKAVQDVYEYNPANNTYTKKAPMPKPQGQCACGVIDNKIYVIAGTGSTNTAFQKTVQVYDPATNTWGTATDYPIALKFLSAATVQNKIVATCGYNNENSSMYYIASTYVGEMVGGTLTWNKVKDYPIGPTIIPSSVGVGNEALFTGGRPSIDGNAAATQRSFKYNVPANAWVTLELKPSGMQSVVQGGTDGQKMYVPGGEDATGGTLGVLEILNGAQAGGPVLVLGLNTLDTWIKKSVPMTVKIPVKNNGAADLNWTATVAAGASAWLSITKTSGTLLPLVSDNIDLTVNAGSLTPGDYSGTVNFTSNDPAHATAAVQVVIHVQDQDVDTAPNVLVEEGTGTWCGYCPYGADSLKSVLDRNKGRAIGISYHGGSTPPTNEPMWTAFTDSWTAQTALAGWPNGSINRVLFAGETRRCLSRDQWGKRVEEILGGSRSPISLNVKSATWNDFTSRVNLDVEVFFHRGFNKQVRLVVAQVQDSMNYRQVYYPSGGGSTALYPYFHNHVLRHMYPSYDGEPVTTGSSVATQTSVRKQFTLFASDTLRSLTRFVIYAQVMNDDLTVGEVLQSTEVSAVDMITAVDERPLADGFELSQNYPNPFNPGTTVSFSVPRQSHVSIVVTDALGRDVATIADADYAPGTHHAQFFAGDLASGLYRFTMRAGSFIQTRSMTLSK